MLQFTSRWYFTNSQHYRLQNSTETQHYQYQIKCTVDHLEPAVQTQLEIISVDQMRVESGFFKVASALEDGFIG